MKDLERDYANTRLQDGLAILVDVERICEATTEFLLAPDACVEAKAHKRMHQVRRELFIPSSNLHD